MPDSEEAGSVLADVFLDMAAENRKRYNKIWKKQEMAFLEALPEREESRRELSGALLVRASDQGNGIWLKEGPKPICMENKGTKSVFARFIPYSSHRQRCNILYGRKGSGSHTLLRRVCTRQQTCLLFVRARELFYGSPNCRHRVRQGLRLLVRLTKPTVVLEFEEEDFDDSSEAEWQRRMRRLFSGLGDSPVCFLAYTQNQAGLIKKYADLCLSLADAMTREEKRSALDTWIPKEERRSWQEELLENYRLNIGELKKRYRSITLQMRVQGSSLTERAIWQEGLQDKQEALRFGKLIEHRYRRADIVLSRDCEKQLETVIRLAKAWRGGRGLRVLFHGSSGTGKTMAAQVMAAELGLPLFKVDLSQVFDKYIGETEKHIDEIFRTARRNRYLLFF